VILSHGLWERRYSSDASIVGRTVRLNREDYVVVGRDAHWFFVCLDLRPSCGRH